MKKNLFLKYLNIYIFTVHAKKEQQTDMHDYSLRGELKVKSGGGKEGEDTSFHLVFTGRFKQQTN